MEEMTVSLGTPPVMEADLEPVRLIPGPGRGITRIDVVDNNHLQITYTDGTTQDAGEVVDAGARSQITTEANRAKGVEGTLANLTTTAKGNLVAAINEVDAHADTNATAISELNGKFTGTDIGVSNAVFRTTGDIVVNTSFNQFEYVDLYLICQARVLPCIRIFPSHAEQTYALNFGYFNSSDSGKRIFVGEFHTAGRYVDTFKLHMGYSDSTSGLTWSDVSNIDLLYVRKIIGYTV